MKLSEWFDAEKKRTGKRVMKAQFGEKIGITGAGVQKILDGAMPKRATVLAIEKATGGKVRPVDFYKTDKEQ